MVCNPVEIPIRWDVVFSNITLIYGTGAARSVSHDLGRFGRFTTWVMNRQKLRNAAV